MGIERKSQIKIRWIRPHGYGKESSDQDSLDTSARVLKGKLRSRFAGYVRMGIEKETFACIYT